MPAMRPRISSGIVWFHMSWRKMPLTMSPRAGDREHRQRRPRCRARARTARSPPPRPPTRRRSRDRAGARGWSTRWWRSRAAPPRTGGVEQAERPGRVRGRRRRTGRGRTGTRRTWRTGRRGRCRAGPCATRRSAAPRRCPRRLGRSASSAVGHRRASEQRDQRPDERDDVDGVARPTRRRPRSSTPPSAGPSDRGQAHAQPGRGRRPRRAGRARRRAASARRATVAAARRARPRRTRTT